MKKPYDDLGFVESAYIAVFGELIDLPEDAEKALEHVLGTISQREAEIFTLRYKDKETLSRAGERYGGLNADKVRQILAKAERRLRYPYRTKILRFGLGAANEMRKT